MKKIVLGVFAALMLVTAPTFAVPVTIPDYPTVDVPEDIARLINDNLDVISKALHDNNVSTIDFENYVKGRAIFGDYKDLFRKKIEADVIITSPPFADSIRFYMQNWMRLWFCGWKDCQLLYDREFWTAYG